ncbi:MAG: hypothetical protein RMY28_035530 [Nostoc sp. ChiSLP01]|nr:hypothetical protein [Nostoc sp. CmiSLP01]MDZ8284874.1 hypothetical protein [Nostoc sp. ChiSLP01]
MEIDLVLNELSLKNMASDEQTARQWMSNFIQTIKAVKSQGVKVSLRTKDNFHQTILAPDYPLRRWLNDKEVDQVERGFIRTLATTSPFSTNITNLDIQDIENNIGLSEFWHQGEAAVGLGIAYMLDTMAISLISAQCWDLSLLAVEATTIDEDREVIDYIVNIIHASRSNHVQEHTGWFKNRIRTGVIDGEDVWNRREELFPNLKFCENTSKQIQSLYSGTPMLTQVVNKLFELENCCKTWTNGTFDLDLLASKATPKSESRLQKLEEKLTFKCPDDKYRIFSFHLRMTGKGAWRLHFSTELGPGKIIIGYIGPKIQ